MLPRKTTRKIIFSQIKENRPSKWEIRKIATRLLIAEITQAPEISNTAKLNTHLNKSTSLDSESSLRMLRKYESGENGMTRNSHLFEKIEAEFPEKVKIFDHPLWLILNNPSCTQKEILLYMQGLTPDVRSIVCSKRKKGGYYPRRVYTDTGSLYRLGIKNDLDALACLLMIIREMEVLGRWDIYIHAKWFAHWLFFRLAHFEPFKIVANKLYTIIYGSFIGKNDPLPTNGSFLNYIYNDSQPKFVNDIKQIDQKFSNILSNDQGYDFNLSNEHDGLKLLFWCCFFGLDKMENVLSANEPSHNDQFYNNVLKSVFDNCTFERPLSKMINYLDVHYEFHIDGSELSIQDQIKLLELL